MLNKFIKENKELVLIILTSVVLLFYLFLKIVFGYYVEAAQGNERFKTICNYIDNNLILTFVLSCIVNYISLYYYYCAIIKKSKLNKNQNIILIFTVILTNFMCTSNIIILGLLSDVIKCLIIPLIYIGKINIKSISTCIIFSIVNIVFQIISVITRDIGIRNVQDDSCIALILSIDVIFMIILLYLYRRKESKKCSY